MYFRLQCIQMNKVSKNLSFWFSLQLICYSFYSTFCSQFPRSHKCNKKFNNFCLRLFHMFFCNKLTSDSNSNDQ